MGDPLDVDAALDALEARVADVQTIDLTSLDADQQLVVIRRLEVVTRRLAHASDRALDQLDRSGGYAVDGHRSARDAVKHLGRLPGGSALARAQTVRALRQLPAVAAAYADGRIPTAHVRAIARVAANPRVTDLLAVADPVFAEQASVEPYDAFVAWLRQWESLADADGAAQAAESRHDRRRLSLTRNAIDGGWTLEGRFGDAQGAALAQRLEHFVDAEFQADWDAAKAIHGDDTCVAHLSRTPAQRRADAVLAMASWAASAPADARRPEPLVDIIIDQATFEAELRRAGGDPGPAVDPTEAIEGHRCQTLDGTPLLPAEAVAAALVGHVRRVVVDAAGTVIDLGRRRRLFTGSSRDAAMVQAVVRRRSGLGCGWPGCSAVHCLQVDHQLAAAAGGRTDLANAEVYCGFHNRWKEHGYKPVRSPDGQWSLLRPDGRPIVAAA